MADILIPTRTDRLQPYPVLARAMAGYLKEHRLSMAKFHARLDNSKDHLGLRKVPAREALDRLHRGKPTFRSTAEAVALYLREHASDVEISDAPQCAASDLNLALFVGVSERKMRRVGPGLAGSYIAYALCESVPGHVRIGEITIAFVPKSNALTITERQARAEMRHGEWRIFATRDQAWEGVIAARKERYVAVLRMKPAAATDFDIKIMVFEVLHQEAGGHRIGEIEVHSFNAYTETGHHRVERYWLVRSDGGIRCTIEPVGNFPLSLVNKISWPNDPLLSYTRCASGSSAQFLLRDAPQDLEPLLGPAG